MAVMIISYQLSIVSYVSKITSGGYCDRVPPLPIPNREVKPACADGTAMQCGRVGSRLLSKQSLVNDEFARLFYVGISGETRITGNTGLSGCSGLPFEPL